MDISIIATAIDHATAPLKQLAASIFGLGEAEKKTGENSQAMANGLKAIEIVIGGILIEKAEELGKKFLEIASGAENADLRFEAWAGSAQNAQKVMADFNKSIGATGVTTEGLINSFVRFRAVGLDQERTVETIKSIANATAALGGDVPTKLDALTTAFARLSAKGVVSTRELNSVLTGTGITVKDMAKASNEGITQFMDDLKSKTEGAAKFIDAFNKSAEAKFGEFGKLLENTVAGSLAKFKKDVGDAFSGLLEQGGGGNVQLTAFIQNLDAAIVKFIHDVGPGFVKGVTQFFIDAAPVIANTGSLILEFGNAIVAVADVIFRILDTLPPAVTQYGLVGYILGGKTGAGIGAAFGMWEQGIRLLGSDIDLLMVKANVAPAFFLKDFVKNQHSLLDAMLTPEGDRSGKTPNGTNNWLSKMIGTPEQIAKIQAGLDQLAHTKFGDNGLTGVPDDTALNNRLEKLREQTNATIVQISDKASSLEFKTSGDELRLAIQGVANETDSWNKALNAAKTNILTSKLPLADQKSIIAQIDGLQLRINTDLTKNVALQDELNALKVDELHVSTQIAALQAQQTAHQLNQQINQALNPQAALIGGTSGYQQQEEFLQKQNQLQQQALQYQQQIDALAIKEKSDTIHAADYQSQIQGLQQVKGLTQQYASTLTAAGMAQTKFLNELGSAIEGDLASGISGLIQGTMTWGDVGRKVFGDLIDMSVKYLLKLAEMELFGETAAASSVALAAPLAASLTAIWGPAAMAASIATLGTADVTGMVAYQTAMASAMLGFADGGVPGLADMSNSIVQGPTMFGVAGEAGSEAILPLTRIGGKLGVRSDGGGGGNHYHITVQAIDTQSGLDFIGKHLGSIDSGLQQRKRVNLK